MYACARSDMDPLEPPRKKILDPWIKLLTRFLELPQAKRNKKDSNDYEKKFRTEMLVCSAVAAVVATMKLDRVRARAERGPNVQRDRSAVKLKILTMKDKTFKRNYRLDRPTFMKLLSQISDDLRLSPGQLSDKANIDPLIMLAATLRFLAGGSYLDIAFGYDIGHASVYDVFRKVLVAVDTNLDNIQFPYDSEEGLRYLEETFLKISKGVFKGTVAAGDGIVFRTFKPAAADVDGNVRSFFTRKGFYGHALQAFSDGNCKFVHISQRVCASTHDSTAYVLTGISESIMKGQLPQWAHIVLDETYKCTEQELSPWKGKTFQRKKTLLTTSCHCTGKLLKGLLDYWLQDGEFFGALCDSVNMIDLIVRVCCKLHNLCVDAFGSSMASVEVCNYDKVWNRGDSSNTDATVLFTDGTTKAQGECLDLLPRRIQLTNELQALGLKRPAHSQFRNVNRI